MADARRTLESSADFTRGGSPPVPDHDATERQRAERIEAEQRRLIAWAKAKGYETLTAGAYYDSEHGLLIFDLFPKNAMQAADGVIYPFDPVIQRIQSDFADFLRANPDRIHNR